MAQFYFFEHTCETITKEFVSLLLERLSAVTSIDLPEVDNVVQIWDKDVTNFKQRTKNTFEFAAGDLDIKPKLSSVNIPLYDMMLLERVFPFLVLCDLYIAS